MVLVVSLKPCQCFALSAVRAYSKFFFLYRSSNLFCPQKLFHILLCLFLNYRYAFVSITFAHTAWCEINVRVQCLPPDWVLPGRVLCYCTRTLCTFTVPGQVFSAQVASLSVTCLEWGWALSVHDGLELLCPGIVVPGVGQSCLGLITGLAGTISHMSPKQLW